MKKIYSLLLGIAVMLVSMHDVSIAQKVSDPSIIIEVGQTAPDFELPGSPVKSMPDKKTFSLSEATKKGPVLLAFFPMAFTGGWRAELSAFHAEIQKFLDLNIQIYGISADTRASNKAFAKDMGVDSFPLLSDNVEKETLQAYGVFNTKFKTAKRSYILVGQNGRVLWSENARILKNDDVIAKIKNAIN